jgi:DNA-binding transcriptional regulator YdaS (Cro superfamily)
MIRQIVDQLGGVAVTSRLLGVSQPAVSQWLRDGRVPPVRAVQIAAEMLDFKIIKQEPEPKTKIETQGATNDGI